MKTEKALAALDAMVTIWAAKIELPRLVRAILAEPDRQHEKLVALVKQAHVEGLYEGRTSHDSAPRQLTEAPTWAWAKKTGCPHDMRISDFEAADEACDDVRIVTTGKRARDAVSECIKAIRQLIKSEVQADTYPRTHPDKTFEGQELYSRHDVCPPLCDAEKLHPDNAYISDLEYEINRLQTLLQAAKKAQPEPITFSDSVVREKGRLMHASGRSHASRWNEITHLAAEFGRASYLKGWRAAERAHNKNQKENP